MTAFATDQGKLGPDNAIWDNGEWISWAEIDTHLAAQELRARYPKADLSLIPFFKDLLNLAEDYFDQTGRHLQVYGDIGELFGAIHFGIKLHRNYAKGSDGRMGNDLVGVAADAASLPDFLAGGIVQGKPVRT